MVPAAVMVMGGNATERNELYEADRSKTATLTLRGGRKQGSVPALDQWEEPAYQGVGPYQGYGTGVTYAASEASGGEYDLGAGGAAGVSGNGRQRRNLICVFFFIWL